MNKVDGGAAIWVEDDGVGFPAGFDLAKSSSLELAPVQVLARQIQGRFKIAHAAGTRCSVEFPIQEGVQQ